MPPFNISGLCRLTDLYSRALLGIDTARRALEDGDQKKAQRVLREAVAAIDQLERVDMPDGFRTALAARLHRVPTDLPDWWERLILEPSTQSREDG